MKKAAELPFRVDRNLRTNLVDQVVDGFRQAIQGGVYRPGDTLPTIRALAPALGVSVRVTAEAVKALTDEGLVSPRSRRGSIVLGKREQLWRGRVLVVLPEGDFGYYQTAFIGRMRSCLFKSGYLFTQVTVPLVGGKRYDTSILDIVINHPIDLAVMLFDCPQVERKLARSGVRYVGVMTPVSDVPNCLGRVWVDASSAIDAFVSHCVMAGVRRVVQVGKGSGEHDASQPLRAAGIEVEVWNVSARRGGRRLDALQSATIELFRELGESGRMTCPDLFYFTDDYLASAAILSLEHLRIRVPEDVKVVTYSNAGHVPVSWCSLTRIEADPVIDGEKVARCLLSCLKGKGLDPTVALELSYRIGESFPAAF